MSSTPFVDESDELELWFAGEMMRAVGYSTRSPVVLEKRQGQNPHEKGCNLNMKPS